MSSYPTDLEPWRRAGQIAGRARELGLRLAQPGMARRELAERIEAFIRDQGAEPAFPTNLSRNWEAAHFTPSETDSELLAPGDLLKVDVGAHIRGAIADTAETVEVGNTHRHDRLVKAVRDALDAGIQAVRPGGSVDAVSRAIERAVHAQGFKPVVDLTGHTIESYLLHAGKAIPNVGGYSTHSLEEGEIVAIEPFVTNGEGHIEDGPFGNIVRFRADPGSKDERLARAFARFRTLPFTTRWVPDPEEKAALKRARRLLQTYPVFVETGRGWVAQAEHTILVGPNGAEVLTRA
ncbi:MAG: type II methionyl aminopeptidase [Thermoplasmata archaeon]